MEMNKSKTAKIVFGLGFGDEGKGSVVDHLVRQMDAPMVVRFNGGAQAAHNVVTSEGLHHTFQQFGAGALAGARTLLSRFMLVDPIRLATEATELSKKLGRWVLNDHFIDASAPVLTPFHGALNRLKERQRGDRRHGSCGNGIGELMADLTGGVEGRPVMRMGNLGNPEGLQSLLLGEIQWRCQQASRLIRRTPGDEYDWNTLHDADVVPTLVKAYRALAGEFQVMSSATCRSMLRECPNLVFEGAQGVLLDENFGFPPHYTWSNCTPANAHTLLQEAECEHTTQNIGVLRSYCTRHGAGPMPTDTHPIPEAWFPGEHNKQNDWQGGWRKGVFDGELAAYAALRVQRAGYAFDIALTHMDIVEYTGGVIAVSNHRNTHTEDEEDAFMAWYDVMNAGDPPDQRLLVEYLLLARPSTPVPVDAASFVSTLEKRTRAKVKFISRGPTAADKEAL